eukprot:10375335-Heterocapsa_arctica.AAC.1
MWQVGHQEDSRSPEALHWGTNFGRYSCYQEDCYTKAPQASSLPGGGPSRKTAGRRYSRTGCYVEGPNQDGSAKGQAVCQAP